ncbi:MAG: hypothetical protein ACP5TJ_00300 [Candidatus Micrarchaeia archaeon]
MPESEERPNENANSQFLDTAIFALAIIGILAVAAYFRTPLLKFYGFYEPDDYYHFSVIRAAVAHNFIVPLYLSISGWPSHTIVSEPRGLYYVVLGPYFLLRFFGVSYYTIMRYISLFFGLFDVLGTYLLARYISKDKLFGLLAMLFVALNMGDAARTSALIFRGDGFITIFLILALAATVAMFKQEKRNKKLAIAVAAGFILSLTNFVWNGGPFTTVVFMLIFIFLISFGFVFRDKKLLTDAKYMLLLFVVWFVFVTLYRHAILIMGQAFTGWHFLPILAILSFSAFFFDWLLGRNELKGLSSYGLFAVFAALLIVVFAIVFAVFPSYVVSIVKSGSFLTMSKSRFAETIQELQPPSTSFLFASFGLQLLMLPMGYAILASTSIGLAKYLLAIFGIATIGFGIVLVNKKQAIKYFLFSLVAFMATLVGFLSSGFVSILSYWTLVLVLSLIYLFLKVFDAGRFANGRARFLFDYTEPMLVVIAYFAVTAYLQMNAIRFNSLVSVPLSILAAYAVYWLLMLSKRYKIVYTLGYIALIAAILAMFLISRAYTANLMPADEICTTAFFCTNPMNPPVVQALSWLKNNSPSNSVVLTLWPDGSLVEGIANRTSVTDSVGSQNGSKADAFAAWLFNSSPDGKFLLSPINGKPNYLLVRYPWLVETGGIYTESGYGTSNYFNMTFVHDLQNQISMLKYKVPFNQLNETDANQINETANTYIESMYGYGTFMRIGEQINATTKEENFTFSGYANYIAKLTIREASTSSGEQVGGYLIAVNSNNTYSVSMFSNVILYNLVNASSTIIDQAAYTNKTNSYSLLVTYSPKPNSKLPINVTGAYMLAPGIAKSNMVKFLYECGYSSCPWDNNIARLQLVYNNLDSKIFKIVYNDTNATIAAIHYT